MKAIADAIGFNLVVISPTIALVLTALILLFFTMQIFVSVFPISPKMII